MPNILTFQLCVHRITLDKSVDLDVGPEYQQTSDYRATLGHKACHSFDCKNSVFQEFEHPRFGRIMSVVAARDIQQGQEIFVSYNYSVPLAPPWYQQLWFHYATAALGWSRQKLEDWAAREVARWGVGLQIPAGLQMTTFV